MQTVGEAYDIITFGKSTKKSTDSQLIGMYGNGLKSWVFYVMSTKANC